MDLDVPLPPDESVHCADGRKNSGGNEPNQNPNDDKNGKISEMCIRDRCKNNLFLKYEKTPPQLIILLGNSAWVLLNKDIEKNWRNIPVILCAEKELSLIHI